MEVNTWQFPWHTQPIKSISSPNLCCGNFLLMCAGQYHHSFATSLQLGRNELGKKILSICHNLLIKTLRKESNRRWVRITFVGNHRIRKLPVNQPNMPCCIFNPCVISSIFKHITATEEPDLFFFVWIFEVKEKISWILAFKNHTSYLHSMIGLLWH